MVKVIHKEWELSMYYQKTIVNPQNGFTLIELSIVVVVIGLIASGIMAGMSLVHESKLRAFNAHLTKMDAALYTFKLQYNASPGDMENASRFWPGANDGNANRAIDSSLESQYLIEHLNVSNTINLQAHSADTTMSVTPSHGQQMLIYTQDGSSNFYGGSRGKTYGQFFTIYGGSNISGLDTFKLDRKIDDGFAKTGKMRGFYFNDDTCYNHDSGTLNSTNFVELKAEYNPIDNNKGCHVQYHFAALD